MKLKNILSNDLPEIDQSIKECVNLGQWILFKSEKIEHIDAAAFFYLKAGTKIFELNDKGRILNSTEGGELDVHIDELFYFSDIPKPSSLSNMSPSF